MKKTILLFITLSVMALAVVFAFTHTYAPQDKVLKENVAALAGPVDPPSAGDENVPKWIVVDRPSGCWNCTGGGSKCCNPGGACPA